MVDSILKALAPTVLQFVFGVVEDALGEVKGGPWRVITPIAAEMLDTAQAQVMMHGIEGVMDEHGRLKPSFRQPFEAKALQALREFGFAESA